MLTPAGTPAGILCSLICRVGVAGIASDFSPADQQYATGTLQSLEHFLCLCMESMLLTNPCRGERDWLKKSRSKMADALIQMSSVLSFDFIAHIPQKNQLIHTFRAWICYQSGHHFICPVEVVWKPDFSGWPGVNGWRPSGWSVTCCESSACSGRLSPSGVARHPVAWL